MPAESGNSIGHYLASRGASSDISSNLTLTKTATKSSTFSSVSDSTKKSSTFSRDVLSSTPVAKPRSVYTEPKPEPIRSSPPRSSPPRSYPLATKNNFDSAEVNIVSHPIVAVGNGGEDWGTKKRVETKTVKTIGKFVNLINQQSFLSGVYNVSVHSNFVITTI